MEGGQLTTPLRIVIVGTAGSGKSATGNTILGERVFESKIFSYSTPKHCQMGTREWKGRKVLVVDTPGFFLYKKTPETTCREISQCVLLSRPGPHAILLVMQLSRYDQDTLAWIKFLFGESVTKHMIIVFTRKDDLEDMSLSDFIAQASVSLRSLLKECDNRCCAFNNRAEEPEKEAQVEELVQLIDSMLRKNGGAYFADPIYRTVEERLKQRVKIMAKIYTDQLNNDIKQVEEEYADSLQRKGGKQNF